MLGSARPLGDGKIGSAQGLVKEADEGSSPRSVLSPEHFCAATRFDANAAGQRVNPLAKGLYSREERARRDASPWTLVQGVLAPLQFVVFLLSLACVARFLLTGAGYELATASILIKTIVLYVIMVTGAIWEKEVFGQYLLAPAFFWEDVVSFGVIALHSLYVIALLGAWASPLELMVIALAAYAAYVVNAAQFLLKLRTARLEAAR